MECLVENMTLSASATSSHAPATSTTNELLAIIDHSSLSRSQTMLDLHVHKKKHC